MMKIGSESFWDDGLFDKAPLGAALNSRSNPDRAIYVVNLFPNKGPIPSNMRCRRANEELTIFRQNARGYQAALPI